MKKYFFIKSAILLILAGFITTCTIRDEENEMIENVGVKSHIASSYFYYYQGERLYFDLDTRYIFVSAPDEQTAQSFSSRHANAMQSSFSVDIPHGTKLYISANCRRCPTWGGT